MAVKLQAFGAVLEIIGAFWAPVFYLGGPKWPKNETKKEIKYVQIVSLTHELYEIY